MLVLFKQQILETSRCRWSPQSLYCRRPYLEGQTPFLPGAKIPCGSRAFFTVSLNRICALLFQLYVSAIWSMSARCVRYSPQPCAAQSAIRVLISQCAFFLDSGSLRLNTIHTIWSAWVETKSAVSDLTPLGGRLTHLSHANRESADKIKPSLLATFLGDWIL